MAEKIKVGKFNIKITDLNTASPPTLIIEVKNKEGETIGSSRGFIYGEDYKGDHCHLKEELPRDVRKKLAEIMHAQLEKTLKAKGIKRMQFRTHEAMAHFLRKHRGYRITGTAGTAFDVTGTVGKRKPATKKKSTPRRRI